MEVTDNLQNLPEPENDLSHSEIDIAGVVEEIPKVFELASNFFDSNEASPLSFESIKAMLFEYLDKNDSQTLESEEISQATQQLMQTFNFVSQAGLQVLKSEEVKQIKQQLQKIKQLAVNQVASAKPSKP